MNNWQTLALCSVLATTMAACSSDDDNSGGLADDDGVAVATTGNGTTTGTTTGATTGGAAGTTGGTTTGTTGGTTGTTTGTTGGTTTGATGGTTTGTTGGTTTGTTGGTTTGTTGGTTGATDGSTTGTTGGTTGATGGTTGTTDGTTGGTTGTTGGTDGETVIGAIPASSVGASARPSNDPFGFTLESDPETSAGVPTQPKNLRADIVSSDWAEISWAPANDDVGVVSYLIERSDGVSYTLSPELTPGLSLDGGTYDEYRKYFQTTSFIDCNSTRFTFAPGSQRDADAPWNCATTRPQPGTTYSYTVTAIDGAGNRSASSDPLQVTYSGGTDFEPTEVGDFIGDFDLVWNDEFNGDAIDPERWQTELVFGDDTFINGEQQYFVPVLEGTDVTYNPFDMSGGTLKINSIRTPAADVAALPASCAETDPVLEQFTDRDHCEFLSGALSSHDRMQFVYGYTEARIRASDVSGALSSFYLYHRYAGTNNEETGDYFFHGPEIDILEYLGENPFGDEDAFQTYHFYDPNTGIIRSSPTMNHEREDGGIYGGEFHTFGVLWEPNLAIWYINGVEVRRLDGPQISQQPMNIINYLVSGSGWAPEPAEGNPLLTMEVDYIRVYQRDAFQGSMVCGNPAVGAAECPAVQ